MATDETISPKEAARLSGRSLRTIRRWLAEGKLVARQPGGPHSLVEIDRRQFFECVMDRRYGGH